MHTALYLTPVWWINELSNEVLPFPFHIYTVRCGIEIRPITNRLCDLGKSTSRKIQLPRHQNGNIYSPQSFMNSNKTILALGRPVWYTEGPVSTGSLPFPSHPYNRIWEVPTSYTGNGMSRRAPIRLCEMTTQFPTANVGIFTTNSSYQGTIKWNKRIPRKHFELSNITVKFIRNHKGKLLQLKKLIWEAFIKGVNVKWVKC